MQTRPVTSGDKPQGRKVNVLREIFSSKMDVVSHIVKFNAQTNGRDKLCRLFQYAAKLAGYNSKKYGFSKEALQKWKALEASLSATRKVLRLGKSLDMVQGALKNLSEPDPVIRFCLVVAKLNQALYLMVDHYIWMSKTGLVKANTKSLTKAAAKFWLVTILANLMRNLYDIVNMVLRERQRQKTGAVKRMNDMDEVDGYSNGTVAVSHNGPGSQNVMAALWHNRPLVVDTVKNMGDLFLPLSSLEYINISEGLQGLLGMISSYMGMMVTWDSSLKLVPS